jgi:hypothetical protein
MHLMSDSVIFYMVKCLLLSNFSYSYIFSELIVLLMSSASRFVITRCHFFYSNSLGAITFCYVADILFSQLEPWRNIVASSVILY